MNSSIKALPLLALVAIGCSDTPAATPSPTPAPTPAPAPVVSATCTYTLSATSLNVAAAGGASTITVTSGTGCAWTATTSASFITITSGASGSGAGSVVLSVAQDPATNRTGTLTIAGQTVTISQTGAGIVVGFNMYDPPSQADAATACRVRGPQSTSLTTCPLLTTSRGTTTALTNWAWTVRYTYGGVAKTMTQSSGTVVDFYFNEFCGLSPSSAGGTIVPLSVSLTVTDANGVQATATSGAGTQPALVFVAYTCG